jgi:hypothetical protein
MEWGFFQIRTNIDSKLQNCNDKAPPIFYKDSNPDPPFRAAVAVAGRVSKVDKFVTLY